LEILAGKNVPLSDTRATGKPNLQKLCLRFLIVASVVGPGVGKTSIHLEWESTRIRKYFPFIGPA
jgi:hypothetical protein